MKKRLHLIFKRSVSVMLLSGACAALVLTVLIYHAPQVSATGGTISGYAWSDNIGWVSLSGTASNGSSYGLTTDGSGNVSGYAWSDNIGWIRPAQSGDGCPGNGAVLSGGNMTGWLYVLSAASSQGSWDGCISLSGSGYGVTTASNPSYNSNFAWGSSVVGWLSFNMVNSCTVSYTCTDSAHSQVIDSQCNQQNLFCAYGCNSGSGQCNVANPPTGCISINTNPASCANAITSAQVKNGATANLYWNVTNAANGCTLAVNGSNLGSVPSVQSSPYPTQQINAKTVYTLTCTASDTSTSVYTATVNIPPVYKEL